MVDYTHLRHQRHRKQLMLTTISVRFTFLFAILPSVYQFKKVFFAGRLSNKFAKIRLLKISPHLKCVAIHYLVSTLVVECPVASTRVQGWGTNHRMGWGVGGDWSELVASYSRMKSAWGWANGGQPILVCYIRKYIIILGGYSRWRPPTKILGGCVPGIPGGVDASENVSRFRTLLLCKVV